MYPHRIRLRGPWEWQRGDRSGTLVLPAVLPDKALTHFRRRFGYPGTIDSHERVWLLVTASRVHLNGHALGEGTAFEITSRLQPRNELVIECDATTPGDVALEVRATAYLSEVHWTTNGVAGRIEGEAAGPMDVYLIVGRSTLAQTLGRAGTAFHLPIETARLDETTREPSRVELVNGAVIWYSQPLPMRGPNLA